MDVSQPSTCGQGLAAGAALPAGLAEVAEAMAGVLERHMTALEVSDPPSAVEHEVYAEVAAAHRRAADQLRAAADRMVAQRDLPMGRHDMAAMAHPEAVRAFQALVDAKRHMLAVLGETAEEDAAMLDTMRSAVRDSDLR